MAHLSACAFLECWANRRTPWNISDKNVSSLCERQLFCITLQGGGPCPMCNLISCRPTVLQGHPSVLDCRRRHVLAMHRLPLIWFGASLLFRLGMFSFGVL